ncbi:hypothetical protein F4824DRAFT_504176 [Ustulina deusta]|nr:hypothetical protein F4824DRAFT_504176 [Ustulina deusta]
MAEAIGFISGALSISETTLRIGQAILELRRLWAKVKDVPSDIIDLTQRLDCLDPSLLEIESIFDFSQVEKTPYLELASKRTAAYCRKALDDLDSLVREMSLLINRHKTRHRIACFRVLLKKDTLSKLENRLGSAVNMLSLVQQTYLIALTRAQPDIILKKWLAHTNRNNDPQCRNILYKDLAPITSHKIHSQSTPGVTACKPENSFNMPQPNHNRSILANHSISSKITMRAPQYLSCKVWEIYFTRALGNWTLRLRSYSTRPSDSRVFQVARSGSPTSLQKLFDAGLASPYDQTIDGATFIHEAARGHNIGTTRYLMTTFPDALDTDNYGLYPLASALDSKCGEKDAEEFVRAMVSDRDFSSDFFLYSSRDEYAFRNTRRTHSEEVSSIAFESQASKLALNIFRSIWLLRIMMQPVWAKDPRQNFIRGAMGNAPLLLIVAATLGGAICPYPCRKCASHCFDWEAWLSSAKTALKQTPDIHLTQSLWMCGPGKKRFTAFTRLLFHSLYFTTHRRSDQWWERHFVGEIRVWLRTLKQEGIDLVHYGRRELEILHEEEAYREWDVAVSYPRQQNEPYFYYKAPFRLIGFVYGPDPGDWVIYLSEPTDLFAGEFWEMIENRPPNMPGSWVDED